MTTCVYILFFIALVHSASVLQSQTDYVQALNGGDRDNFPIGDPRRCISASGRLLRFEVLPGGGWDNIQNKEMGMVVAQNFSRCQTTDDGKYLIPDGTYTVPIKSSKVEAFAELIEHWDNYTSTLSRSLNLEAGLNLPHVGIDGKFSTEYESVKSLQYSDKSMTTRVQARYVRYTAKQQPDTALNPAFRGRLLKIAAFSVLNRTDLAQYESQLLVRDFGTHVITSVDAGAALVQVEHIHSEYVVQSQGKKSTILAAASASFFGVFNFGASYAQTATETDVNGYQKSRTDSKIMTFGGPVFRPQNYSSGDWIASVDNDLVALDKSGDPIYYTITTATLPEVPESTVYDVYNYVKDAVYIYYKHNVYRGCTDRDSPNFNFQANVNDDTCLPPTTNFTFGGVYQECQASGYADYCPSMRQKNPMTGDYSCPNGYEAVPVQSGSKSYVQTVHSCNRCWLFWTCCHDYNIYANAAYTAYWCAARGPVGQRSGFLFGGLFTSTTINPFTQSMSCPIQFYQLTILDGLTICVSDDYELGYQYSLPFAGFYSCKAGNPLALKGTSSKLQSNIKLSVLKTFMQNSGVTSYPHSCPESYSQHLAFMYDGCEINYCVKFGALTANLLPKLQRPPFMKAPRANTASNNSYVMKNDGSVWLGMGEASEAMSKLSPHIRETGEDITGTISSPENLGTNESGTKSGLSGGGIAVISVATTLGCVIIASLIFVGIRRRRSVKSKLYVRTSSPSTYDYTSM